ncbi:hypothetical protein LMG19089_04766 [Ralstonia edaphis]|uniref:P-loop ATPase, Sll1717 family n=1 Tax=Ralstonia edaphi TaxID=3058599 RepID=UPI0028F61F37|nr:hypothetical protein [Ralstonia sp. LMG 6871]CAJ0708770.1 hypothetical protein LMG19089_04766 [Ralstonia sp. LMG 6871]
MTYFQNVDYDEMFGNDSGENERDQTLMDYFVELPEFKKFFNDRNELGIVRARKGMGKSAMLKFLSLRRKKAAPEDLVIFTTGNELMGMGEFTGKSQAYLENHWKQVICKRICIEIGKKINIAFTDLEMSMVEAAELEGFKNLNLLSALTERAGGMLQKMLTAAGGPSILDAAKKRGVVDPVQALKNFQEKGERNVWILIDDIDAKYVDDDDNQQRVGAFFSALRSLAFNVSGLRLRASVRTDVWRNLRKMEDQDKIRQYVIDISWRDEALRSIFAKKILTYLQRKQFSPALQWDEIRNYDEIFDQVFYGKFYWSKQSLEPFIPLKFLAGSRPRWMGQLVKMAGTKAGTQRISQANVNDAMQDFGQEKISDILKEHSHQFAELEKLIHSFRGGKREYNRYQLLKLIKEKFTDKIISVPPVNGFPYKETEQLAEFLFEIDFLVAHRSGKSDFVMYNNDPELFSTEENSQNKINWTVHSSYRNFLRIE